MNFQRFDDEEDESLSSGNDAKGLDASPGKVLTVCAGEGEFIS